MINLSTMPPAGALARRQEQEKSRCPKMSRTAVNADMRQVVLVLPPPPFYFLLHLSNASSHRRARTCRSRRNTMPHISGLSGDALREILSTSGGRANLHVGRAFIICRASRLFEEDDAGTDVRPRMHMLNVHVRMNVRVEPAATQTRGRNHKQRSLTRAAVQAIQVYNRAVVYAADSVVLRELREAELGQGHYTKRSGARVLEVPGWDVPGREPVWTKYGRVLEVPGLESGDCFVASTAPMHLIFGDWPRFSALRAMEQEPGAILCETVLTYTTSPSVSSLSHDEYVEDRATQLLKAKLNALDHQHYREGVPIDSSYSLSHRNNDDIRVWFTPPVHPFQNPLYTPDPTTRRIENELQMEVYCQIDTSWLQRVSKIFRQTLASYDTRDRRVKVHGPEPYPGWEEEQEYQSWYYTGRVRMAGGNAGPPWENSAKYWGIANSFLFPRSLAGTGLRGSRYGGRGGRAQRRGARPAIGIGIGFGLKAVAAVAPGR